MKTIQEIEEEYETFSPVSTFLTNLDELHAFLEVGIDDTKEIEKDYVKEIRINKKMKLESQIRNFLFFMFEEDDIALYDDDNKVLQELIMLARSYRTIYQRVIASSTEETLKDFIKLIDFLTKYYNSHIDYFENERDRIELVYKGINMCNPKHEDNRKVVEEFANKKIEELSKKSAKTYIKRDV